LGVFPYFPVLTVSQNFMEEEKIWDLIAKKLSCEASQEELQDLETLLHGHPDLHYPMQAIIDLWNTNPNQNKEDASKAFDKHLERIRLQGISYEKVQAGEDQFKAISSRFRKNKRKSFFAWSGAALLVLAGIYTLPKFSGPSPAQTESPAKSQSEITTRNGSKTNLHLPDGTQVWLNAGSKLTYDVNFGTTLREVVLTGEAFFDVVHNSDKPFIIHTAKMDIRVLGTRFNVRSYPNDKTSEASLIRGSIEVSLRDRPDEKIILKPNEKIVVANDEVAQHRPTPVTRQAPKTEPMVSITRPTYEANTGAIIETSWVEGRLAFQDEEFSDLARKMERWYGITIKFEQPALERLRFTGSFQKETAEQAFNALKQTSPATPFDYKIVDNQITIYE